jgi:tyrosine aminotransferase
VQGALNYILNDTPESFYLELNRTLKENADYTVERISKIPGLKVVRPQGAMYCMVGIQVDKFDKSLISDDVTFSKMLLKEESVLVLPGQCFRMSNFFRIVLCPPLPKLKEAYDRLEQFCLRYYKA